MASGEFTSNYPGRPYYMRFRWWTVENNIGGNYSRYGWDLAAISKQGWGSWNYDCGGWGVHVGGYNWGGCTALVFGPSGDFAGKTIWLGSGTTGPVVHDGNGYLGFQVSATHNAPGPFGSTTIGWHWVNGDRIPKVPPATTPLSLDEISTVSMRYRFSGNGDGGSPITTWQIRYHTSDDFGPGTVYANSSGTSTVSGLDPGTRYFFQSRGWNAVGAGPWSSVMSATTIPAVAPGISVSPALSGLGATVTMSPPGGVTGVTEYNVEYRPVLGGSTIAGTTPGTVFTVASGLTPGVAYEYRANAEIGGYTSPWTDWVGATQPDPNTNAGDFFSGSSADTADTNFDWLGAPQNSISVAKLNVVTGWMTFGQGNDDSGGSGVVGQVASSLAGGYRGDKLVKIVFHSDATSEGFVFGVGVGGAGEVEEGSPYVGSMFVRLPARTQRIQGGIAWYNAADTLIDYTWDADEVVLTPQGSTFTRITATGVAPVGAVKGAPVGRDVSGIDWSEWQGGDVIYLDAAMLTLNGLFTYFDGSYADSIYDSDEYDYEWKGAPHASASVRYNIENAFVSDPLADPDCTTIPAPPMPPAIPSDCIEEVGVWRRYIVQVPASEVPLWAATLPTLILNTGSVPERQVRIRYFANPDGIAPEAVPTTEWVAEMILTYIPPNTVITMDGVTQRVRAEVNGGFPITANHLLYGTNGTPASWPELRCGMGYIITLDVPLDAPSGNLVPELELTQRM